LSPKLTNLRQIVWDYYHDHGRDLPWRHDPTPYQVLVSEIMLQQTQVARVLERYPRWLQRFPSFEALARASVAEVLDEWQGMGYNRRALWLHKVAQAVVGKYGGNLPSDPAELVTLPGIGTNTAGSIVAFAFNAPVVFIETNIRRVFLHEVFADEVGVDDKQLLPLIGEALDEEHPREWYYALMDYGAYLAKTVPNPNRRSKHHTVQSKFEGSRRQLRGEILRQLLVRPRQLGEFEADDERLEATLQTLVREGFVIMREGQYILPTTHS
jgi:A/G-specific adenine glycosylase